MAEAKAAPEGEKKKKGKLPVILALVAMLGAGGFFGMKLGGGNAKKEPPKLELGEIVPLGEFLVNLNDGRTFLKAEVSVQLSKTGKLEADAPKGEGKAEPPAPVRDAVISVLSSKSLNEVSSPEGKSELKREIAEAVNKAVESLEPEKDKAKDGKGKEDHSAKKDEKGKEIPAEVVDDTWDSQTGPVLKVYFTNFATQQ